MIDELIAFDKLLKQNPKPGTKNEIVREGNVYVLPSWVFGEDKTHIRYKTVKRTCIKYGITDQILYDVLVLGLISIDDRPKCPICGKPVSFKNINFGYYSTCSSKSCISENNRKKVAELWKDSAYRTKQINTKKVWMNKPEKLEFFRKRALNSWKDSNYRKKQIESHIEYCKNNPDKVMNGIHGEADCVKSVTGKLSYDSSWERDFINFCNTESIIKSINRAGIYIPYFDNKEMVTRYYYPDFFVVLENNQKLLIEIKSDWLFETDYLTKLKIEAGKNYVLNSQDILDYLVFQENDLYIVKSKPEFKTKELSELFKKYL